MINANIWIRDPYPFRYEGRQAIAEALRQTYGVPSLIYFHEWPVDQISINATTMATCKQIASTLKTIHRQWAIQEKGLTGRSYCQQLDIDIRGIADEQPTWVVSHDN